MNLITVLSVFFSVASAKNIWELPQLQPHIVSENEETRAGRILNGTRAVPGQFPYFVELVNNAQQPMCGASIINTNWVLTVNLKFSDQTFNL